MKAIAIVELPDDADLTKLRANVNIEKIRECGYDYEPYTFRLHCHLRLLPEKTIDASDDYFHGYCNGRNDCISNFFDRVVL